MILRLHSNNKQGVLYIHSLAKNLFVCKPLLRTGRKKLPFSFLIVVRLMKNNNNNYKNGFVNLAGSRQSISNNNPTTSTMVKKQYLLRERKRDVKSIKSQQNNCQFEKKALHLHTIYFQSFLKFSDVKVFRIQSNSIISSVLCYLENNTVIAMIYILLEAIVYACGNLDLRRHMA